MRVLLDTHVLLGSLGAKERLPAKVQAALTNPGNAVYFSAASIWEIAIKSALGRADFQADSAEVMAVMPQTGFVELPISGRQAKGVVQLPPYHKDPFDRLLIALAEAEQMLLITNDDILVQYSPLARLLSKF